MHPLFFFPVYNTLLRFINPTVLGNYSEARRRWISWTVKVLPVYCAVLVLPLTRVVFSRGLFLSWGCCIHNKVPYLSNVFHLGGLAPASLREVTCCGEVEFAATSASHFDVQSFDPRVLYWRWIEPQDIQLKIKIYWQEFSIWPSNVYSNSFFFFFWPKFEPHWMKLGWRFSLADHEKYALHFESAMEMS